MEVELRVGDERMSLDMSVKAAAYGHYYVFAYDENDQNPQALGSGAVVDTAAPEYLVPIDAAQLKDRLLWVVVRVATQGQPELVTAELTVRQGVTALASKPLTTAEPIGVGQRADITWWVRCRVP